MSQTMSHDVTTAELVELKGGLRVRVDVLAFVVGLEMRGFKLALVDGRIHVEPRAALSERDVAFLKAHRWHVLGLVGYEPPAVRR